MKIVHTAPLDIPTDPLLRPRLFLAGGISNCRDWQSEAIAKIGDDLDVVIFNPRREGFVPNGGEDAREQIVWEHERLQEADLIAFWFCRETVCPITLYELGKLAYNGGLQDVIVGSDPEYSRLFDLQVQLELVGHGPNSVITDFDAWVAAIRDTLSTYVVWRE